MKIVLFYHSLISDWNHGNAHFLRGVVSELIARGHSVKVYEPEDAWSVENLIRDHGTRPLDAFKKVYPHLSSLRYRFIELDLNQVLENAELVLVHEWNDPKLVKLIGEHRAQNRSYKLLFHDTHHRMVSDQDEMSRYDLRYYDGVLAFGKVIADLYQSRGLAEHAWIWHEAADTRVFRPIQQNSKKDLDLVWIGNWGDDERTEELQEFLIGSVKELNLKCEVYGVRYPDFALKKLHDAGIRYQGWIANFNVPEKFSQARFTVHIPRGPYVRALPGIPTIRVFEALACGIPLISAPWEDSENLFRTGEDFLLARSGSEMRQQINRILKDPEFTLELTRRGRQTVLNRHTCAHRVDELLNLYQKLRSPGIQDYKKGNENHDDVKA